MASIGTPGRAVLPMVDSLCSFPAGSTKEVLGTPGDGSSSGPGSLSGVGCRGLVLGRALGRGLGGKQPMQGAGAGLGVGTEPTCPAAPELLPGGSGEPWGSSAGRKGAPDEYCGLSVVTDTVGEDWRLGVDTSSRGTGEVPGSAVRESKAVPVAFWGWGAGICISSDSLGMVCTVGLILGSRT